MCRKWISAPSRILTCADCLSAPSGDENKCISSEKHGECCFSEAVWCCSATRWKPQIMKLSVMWQEPKPASPSEKAWNYSLCVADVSGTFCFSYFLSALFSFPVFPSCPILIKGPKSDVSLAEQQTWIASCVAHPLEKLHFPHRLSRRNNR